MGIRRKVFVSMVGNLIAVAVNQDTATKQLHEMVMVDFERAVQDAKDNGEIRKSIKTRIVYVELDEN